MNWKIQQLWVEWDLLINMKWIKSYKLFENNKSKNEIKTLLEECVERIAFLFKYLNKHIAETIELRNENKEGHHAPAIMFNNNIQSIGNDLDIDDTIFNMLAKCMFGKCSALNFTDKNGIFIENKFIVFPEEKEFKINVVNKFNKNIFPIPDTKEEILFLTLQNYAKLLETHQIDYVRYNGVDNKKKIAKTGLYVNILIDYCYYLINNYKNGMNLFTVDSNELLNSLCYITYNHLSKNPSGYKYLFEIQNRYPKFYSKLQTIFGDDVNRASDMGGMGFADDN